MLFFLLMSEISCTFALKFMKMRKIFVFAAFTAAMLLASCGEEQGNGDSVAGTGKIEEVEGLRTRDVTGGQGDQPTVNAGQTLSREEQLFQQAMVYFMGDGVEQDKKKAFELCQQSAEMGYVIAQFNLAVFYYNGDGVARDEKQVFYWMEKAAQQNHLQAIIQLSKCYRMGLGVKRDDAKGVEWLEKAAKMGDVESQYQVGMAYYKGIGVTPDYEKAVYWYEKAAKGGSSEAQNELGLCYENGLGVFRVDKEAALRWYKKSADQGNKVGMANYERLKNADNSPIFEIKN